MTRRFARPALFACAFLMASPLAAAEAKDPLAPGSRSGPFVVSTRSLGELASDGYEIRGNLGTALVLQKAASIFTCSIPPDPEHLSYRPYFVCSELQEDRQTISEAVTSIPPMPGGERLKLETPNR
jgi:hypothetical protein